jgi:hypothetical protein
MSFIPLEAIRLFKLVAQKRGWGARHNIQAPSFCWTPFSCFVKCLVIPTD